MTDKIWKTISWVIKDLDSLNPLGETLTVLPLKRVNMNWEEEDN